MLKIKHLFIKRAYRKWKIKIEDIWKKFNLKLLISRIYKEWQTNTKKLPKRKMGKLFEKAPHRKKNGLKTLKYNQLH